MATAIANGRSFHVQELSPRTGEDPATSRASAEPAETSATDPARDGGPPTVLVHGLLLDNLASWYFGVAPLLAEELGRRQCMYDLRGHGKSEHATDGFDVATQSADLAALLDIWSPDQAVDLVGHSYGGLIALRLALQNPARIRRLALVDVPLPPSRLDRVRDVLSGGTQAILDAIPENLRANLTGGTRRAARTMRSLTRLLSNSTLVADLQAEGDLPDRELASLTMPLALVYGSNSSCLPTGKRLAALLPSARLTVLEGGHYLPVEKPADLAAALGDFLRG